MSIFFENSESDFFSEYLNSIEQQSVKNDFELWQLNNNQEAFENQSTGDTTQQDIPISYFFSHGHSTNSENDLNNEETFRIIFPHFSLTNDLNSNTNEIETYCKS